MGRHVAPPGQERAVMSDQLTLFELTPVTRRRDEASQKRCRACGLVWGVGTLPPAVVVCQVCQQTLLLEEGP